MRGYLSEVEEKYFGFSSFLKIKWTTHKIFLFFPHKYTLRPLICVEVKLTLLEPWMCRVWWTPCGNYPGRSCGTEVCVSPLQWSHANITFQHTKQHYSNISYTIYTQHTEKWKEKSDKTSYLHLFQACTQPHTFQFPENLKFKYLDHNTMFTDTQEKRKIHLTGHYDSSIFRKHAFI